MLVVAQGGEPCGCVAGATAEPKPRKARPGEAAQHLVLALGEQRPGLDGVGGAAGHSVVQPWHGGRERRSTAARVLLIRRLCFSLGVHLRPCCSPGTDLPPPPPPPPSISASSALRGLKQGKTGVGKTGLVWLQSWATVLGPPRRHVTGIRIQDRSWTSETNLRTVMRHFVSSGTVVNLAREFKDC